MGSSNPSMWQGSPGVFLRFAIIAGTIVGQFNPPSVQTAEESSKFSVGLMWMVTGSTLFRFTVVDHFLTAYVEVSP